MKHHIVLSRKYRPKNLNDLVGQEVLAKSLKSCLDSKKVPHAFLFHGIRGVGKTTTARILARCLSCLGPDGTTDITSSPCGICRSCIAIDRDQHMDIMEFDAASRTGVDDIREIIDATQYVSLMGRYKIFIVDEVHMLSKSAFNALLKTLEEPPSHVKFVFATTEIQKIPETISSRCMTFKLSPVSIDSLANHLMQIAQKEGFELSQDAGKLIAEEAEGSVRDALSILEQAIMLSTSDSQQRITVDLISNMLGGATSADVSELINLVLEAKTSDALLKVESMIKNGVDPFVLFKNLQSELYGLIYRKVTGKVEGISLSNLLYLWQILLKQTENMKNSSYPKYVLIAAIVILAHTASFPSIENLMFKDNSGHFPPKESNKLHGKLESILDCEIVSEKDPSKELIDNVLNKFPGTVAHDVG